MKKNKRIFKLKFFFNLSLKKKKIKNIKKILINKLIKSKRVTGLFKFKFNMRKTILKKRSLIFLFLEKKRKERKKFRNKLKYRNFRFKFKKQYKIQNLNFCKNIKHIFNDNRKILKFFFKKRNVFRQNKFSKFLINFLNKNPKFLINHFEYKLYTILIKTHIFSSTKDSIFFIKNNGIIVNNKLTNDCNFCVNSGDFIKIPNKINYYFFFRKDLTKSLKMSKKINWAFFKFIKKNKKNNFFPKVYNWINTSKYFGFDISKNFEVDFVNMTVFVLSKSFDIKNIEYSNIKFINLYLTRLYNWNYIV